MKLTDEQQAILRGDSGRAIATAMRTLVEYGEAFGANRLVPISSGHLAGSIGAFPYKAYFGIIDQLVDEGAQAKVPTTVNPRPGATLSLINRFIFSKQKHLERQFEALGVIPNYSCVCYEQSNVPKLGERIGWAESSAVQYANSILGARTNRNSVLIDVCSAVTGVTPEFGYLLDENRIGKLLVKLQIDRMDPSALGYVLGQLVVDRVPVIEHYPFTNVELKNMGGAMAASGAVAMFHVEGLTPEAPDLQTAFQGDPPETVTITQKDIDSIRSTDNDPDLVVFGCPHMTYTEAMELGQAFDGKTCRRNTWFCLVPDALERFKETAIYQVVVNAGVEVHQHCPLAALTVRAGKSKVLTSSGKLYYYLAGSSYGTIQDCVRACGVA